MSYQPSATQQEPRRGRGALWVGIALILAGIVAAVVLVLVSSARRTDTVKKLARAVAGQQTTLEFEQAGLYTMYYEYKGSFPATIDGESRTIVLSAPETPPEFDLVLADLSDEALPLRRPPDISYSGVSGYSGTAYKQVRIREPGVYLLRIVAAQGELPEFAIAIGKEVPDRFGPLAFTGIGLGLAGLILGVVLIAVGGRRRTAAAQTSVGAEPSWAPGALGGWQPPGSTETLPSVPPTQTTPAGPPASAMPSPNVGADASLAPHETPGGAFGPPDLAKGAAPGWAPPGDASGPGGEIAAGALGAALSDEGSQPATSRPSSAPSLSGWAPPGADTEPAGAGATTGEGVENEDEEGPAPPSSGAPLPPPGWPPPGS
jgi:hypothetical protein